MAESIHVSYILNFDTDGNLTVEEMDAILKTNTRDTALALGMAYDTTSISSGVVTSSLSGSETFGS